MKRQKVSQVCRKAAKRNCSPKLSMICAQRKQARPSCISNLDNMRVCQDGFAKTYRCEGILNYLERSVAKAVIQARKTIS